MKKRIDVFDIINYTGFVFLCFLMIYPFWHCLAGSFMSFAEFTNTAFVLFPNRPTLSAYMAVFVSGQIFTPFLNTVVTTVINTVLSIFFTSYVAYGLSKKFPGQKLFMTLFIITMYVDAGLIPTYILFKQIHLINNYSVYIVPSLLSIWNLIIFRTSFMSFEPGLIEAAKIDGYSEFTIFLKIVLPLNMATIAALSLFTAVGSWNNLFTSLFFVTSNEKKLLQEYLYRILNETAKISGSSANAAVIFNNVPIPKETVKLANTIVTIIPIVMVYPFLQKYFVKGVMIGAIKG
jgi:putative aldouronate transport system permease protein